LKKYGIEIITVSINTLREDNYKTVTGSHIWGLDKVLDWLQKAKLLWMKININLTAVDSLVIEEIQEVITYARENWFMMRICEPLYVIWEETTKEKKVFNEILWYLLKNNKNIVYSWCESVTYIEDLLWWRITIFHSLCDNRFCNGCGKYVYLRLTSDRKLKPCLSRIDTEVALSENPDNKELEYAFYKSISNMGNWPDKSIYGLNLKNDKRRE